jgi:uncharacterized membrane protein
MTNIPINAKVECADGRCGKSVTVIVNPVALKVTHVVVQDRAFPHSVQRLVPIEQVVEATPDLIRLSCTIEELGEMETFVETHYVKDDRVLPDYPSDHQHIAPYVSAADEHYRRVDMEKIPEGTLAVRRGMQVEATDGSVGQVGELVLDPESGQITHFVLQEGHIWGTQEMTLPLSAIGRVEENTVYLALDKEAIGKIPAMRVVRRQRKGKANVELIARAFKTPDKASEALEFVQDLQRRKIFKILSAAVVVKDENGKTTVKETGDLDAKQGRLLGAVTGGLLGLAAGPVGAVVGAIAGAGTGGVAAKWIDMGISDSFLSGIQEHLQPDTSALIVLVEEEWAAKASESLADLEGFTCQQTLTDELVERLLAETPAEA